MGDIFATVMGCIMILLYIFLAWRFALNSLRTLQEHFRRERQPYEIIPGTIVDFELRWNRRPRHSGKYAVFYPVFEYKWKGRTHRKFHRRCPSGFGPDLQPVPLTRLKVGDAVQVRLFPGKPSDARLEESFYFWKSRIWVHMLTVVVGCVMAGFGICSAISMVMQLF